MIASKLQLKDNKCPVCDSNVEKLNPLFQEEHLKNEIIVLKEKITLKEKEKNVYNQKRKEFSEKLQNARDAETTLRAYSINNKEELMKIQEDVNTKKQNVQRIPLDVNGNLLEISHIDSHAKMIFESISKLEIETSGFDEQEFLKTNQSFSNRSTNWCNFRKNFQRGRANNCYSKCNFRIKYCKRICNKSW